MSTTLDNVTLALVSLKQSILTYLDSNGWRGRYNIFIESDDSIRRKVVVEKVTDPNKEIALPILVIELSSIRNEVTELGNSSGNDVIYCGIVVKALDYNQKVVLGNTIRRYLNDLQYPIYDTRVPILKQIGNGFCTDPVLDDISDVNSDNFSERFAVLINFTLELNAQQLI